MKVTLREKKLLHGKRSLYLDFYPPIIANGKKTRREFLSLYVYAKPKTELEREENKETRILAEGIRAKRQIELQGNPHGFISSRRRNGDFIAFFNTIAERRGKKIPSTAYGWRIVADHLRGFTGGNCVFSNIDPAFVAGFQNYLLNCPIYKNKAGENIDRKTLSPNSVKLYFDRFCSVIREAVRDKYILDNPLGSTERIRTVTPKRDFLSLDELRTLAQTECDIPDNFRRAVLFSTLSGLRFSDIKRLTWSNVRNNKTTGDYLDFKIKKTGEQVNLPISSEARELLGERGESNLSVFFALDYAKANNYLEEWTQAAGIGRRITFHALRRTYATGLISAGVDIYTLSKMLSHSNVRTTQIYAVLIDERKRDAANKISLK